MMNKEPLLIDVIDNCYIYALRPHSISDTTLSLSNLKNFFERNVIKCDNLKTDVYLSSQLESVNELNYFAGVCIQGKDILCYSYMYIGLRDK